jgi:hypothetical protein
LPTDTGREVPLILRESQREGGLGFILRRRKAEALKNGKKVLWEKGKVVK